MIKKWSWVVLAVLTVGCAQPAATVDSPKGANDPTPAANPGEKPKDPVAEAPKPGEEAPKPTLSTAEIPAELKHTAYDYYGLGYGKPIPMLLKHAGDPDQIGNVETKLIEVTAGKAKFEQVFSEGLVQFGTSSLLLDKKGVYSSQLAGATLDKPQLELPAEIKPGFKWGLDGPMVTPGQTVTKLESTIVGVEKVTVPRGTYDALKVKADVIIERGKEKSTVKMTAWYAKGLGTVKLVMEFTPKGKKVETSTLLAK